MSIRDRDLLELARFQLRSLQFCQQVAQLSSKLLADTNAATGILQDDASRSSLQRLTTAVDRLISISNHGATEMEAAARKTHAELEKWNAL